jgi:hypothetical protein
VIPQIRTDLFNGGDDEGPLESGPSAAEVLLESLEIVEASVVRLEDEENSVAENDGVAEHSESDEDEDGKDEDLLATMEDIAPKKRGRPSLAAATPKATPKGKANPKSTGGKKRKADEAAEEPVAKRNGGRATAVAANSAIKESSAKRARAPNGSAKAVSTPGIDT